MEAVFLRWSQSFSALDLHECAQQPNENPEKLRLLGLVLGRWPRNVGFWHPTDDVGVMACFPLVQLHVEVGVLTMSVA